MSVSWRKFGETLLYSGYVSLCELRVSSHDELT